MTTPSWRDRLAAVLFRHRALILILFLLVTIGFAAATAKLRIDAGFDKMLPLEHPYMQTFDYTHRQVSLNRSQIRFSPTAATASCSRTATRACRTGWTRKDAPAGSCTGASCSRPARCRRHGLAS